MQYSSIPCCLSGKTDPYVILSLGDQIMRSKKNSRTTVIGRPGEPIWNQVILHLPRYMYLQTPFVLLLEVIVFYDFGQDFHMLVANPRKQKLNIQVKDSLGFTDLTVGTGEVNYLIPKNSFFFFFVKVQSGLSCFLQMALLVEWLIA
jgi:hypothetical protein